MLFVIEIVLTKFIWVQLLLVPISVLSLPTQEFHKVIQYWIASTRDHINLRINAYSHRQVWFPIWKSLPRSCKWRSRFTWGIMVDSQTPNRLLRPWVTNSTLAASCHTTLSRSSVVWPGKVKVLFMDMMLLVVMTRSLLAYRELVRSLDAQFSTTNSRVTIIWIQNWHRIESRLRMLPRTPFTPLPREIFILEITLRLHSSTQLASRPKEKKSEEIEIGEKNQKYQYSNVKVNLILGYCIQY